MNFKFLKAKKGETTLGSLITTFIATILIIIILLVFVAVSGIVKAVGNVNSGVGTVKESAVGLGGVDIYFSGNYADFVKARFDSASQKVDIGTALREVGYGK